MDERFVWKAEIKFRGTAEEFNQLMASLQDTPVELDVREWGRRPHHLAGCMPIAVDVLLDDDMIARLVEGMPRMKLKYIQGIPGGIRDAHFHLADEVVLLDRERFRTYVGQVAQKLAARRVESVSDYIAVMEPVGRLADPTPQPSRGIMHQ